MNRREWLAMAAAGLVAIPGWAEGTGHGVLPSLRFMWPDDADYAALRGGFSKRIERKPAMLAMCTSVEAVRLALEYSKLAKLPVGIRSGGHCFEGHGLIDRGMLIDVSAMNSVSVNGTRATIGPGAKLGSVYSQLAAKGRLLPAGSCAGVGAAGLALGGGYGFFAREHGLTCDHLVGLELIDAAGRVHKASGDDALMRACRGGGNGHFGVVTKLEFETRVLPKRFADWRWRFRQLDVAKARSLAERWCALAEHLPNTCYSSFVLNGSTLTVLCTDSADRSSPDLVKRLAEFSADATETLPAREAELLPGIQRFSGGTTPMYFKNFSAGYYADWADLGRGFDALAAIVTARKPTSILQINTLGGAIHESPRASSYPHRAHKFLGEFQVYWNTPKQADTAIALAADARRVIGTHWNAHYANYPNDDFTGAAKSYYGSELSFLKDIKKKLDPDRRFREASAL